LLRQASVDATKVRALRQQLQLEHVVSWFTTPSDLEARVSAAVTMAGLTHQLDLQTANALEYAVVSASDKCRQSRKRTPYVLPRCSAKEAFGPFCFFIYGNVLPEAASQNAHLWSMANVFSFCGTGGTSDCISCLAKLNAGQTGVLL
jgi:hypothetical protein